ncbi:MAG: hypothetical protein EBV05_14290 [Cyanobacteria bacterium WB6_1B_304]|jgi:hypothetical protein|nr:hypothetical protein [Cyanobacteria bacterium WB6_1B_304]
MGGMIRTTGTKVESSGARVRQGPALVDDAGFIFGGKPAPREVSSPAWKVLFCQRGWATTYSMY